MRYEISEDDLRVLRELSLGRSDKRAALYLGSSDRTIRRRLNVIMRGYGVSSRFSLGILLGQLGVVRLPVPAPARDDAPPGCRCR